MRNAVANGVAGVLTVLLFVGLFGALGSCARERVYAPAPPAPSVHKSQPYTPPAPVETSEPAGAPVEVDVDVDHDDDGEAWFCQRRRWC